MGFPKYLGKHGIEVREAEQGDQEWNFNQLRQSPSPQ